MSVTEKFMPLHFRPKKPHIIGLFPFKTNRMTVDLRLLRIINYRLLPMNTNVVVEPFSSSDEYSKIYLFMNETENLSTFVGKYSLD